MSSLQEAADKVALGIRTGSNGAITTMVVWTGPDRRTAHVRLSLPNNGKSKPIGHLVLTWQDNQPYIDTDKLEPGFLPEITEHIARCLNTSMRVLKGRNEALVLVSTFGQGDKAVEHITDALLRLPSLLGSAGVDGPKGQQVCLEFAQGMLEQLDAIAPTTKQAVIKRIKADHVLRGSTAFRWLMTAMGIKPLHVTKVMKIPRVKDADVIPSKRMADEVRELLTAFMKKHGFSQRDVADALGSSQAHVYRFMNGQRGLNSVGLGRIEKMIADHGKAQESAPVKAEYGGVY